MEKTFSINSKRLTFLILVFLFLNYSDSHAQLFTKPLPRAWVSKAESEVRKTWFQFGQYPKSKGDVFHNIMGNYTPNLYYTNASIGSLLNSLKSVVQPFTHINIYITSYHSDANCSNNLPVITSNELLLVFAPANQQSNTSYPDVGRYFVITTDGAVHEINGNCMKKWNDNYYDVFIKGVNGLEYTIDRADSENQLPDKTISDTKRLTYSYDSFVEFWEDERKLLINKRKINVVGIRADFVQYTDMGTPDRLGRLIYKHRLHLQFEFVKSENGIKSDFSHEYETNFSRRLKKYYKKYNNINLKGGNHGQLCPTICN